MRQDGEILLSAVNDITAANGRHHFVSNRDSLDGHSTRQSPVSLTSEIQWPTNTRLKRLTCFPTLQPWRAWNPASRWDSASIKRVQCQEREPLPFAGGCFSHSRASHSPGGYKGFPIFNPPPGNPSMSKALQHCDIARRANHNDDIDNSCASPQPLKPNPHLNRPLVQYQTCQPHLVSIHSPYWN